VPQTSTYALTNATLAYALAVADKGWGRAAADDSALAAGVNVALGKLTHKAVADAHGLPWTSIDRV
jgi:alanine dehydrogenase